MEKNFLFEIRRMNDDFFFFFELYKRNISIKVHWRQKYCSKKYYTILVKRFW